MFDWLLANEFATKMRTVSRVAEGFRLALGEVRSLGVVISVQRITQGVAKLVFELVGDPLS